MWPTFAVPAPMPPAGTCEVFKAQCQVQLKDNCPKLQAEFEIALQCARTWSAQFLSVLCNEGFDFRLLPVWQSCKLPSYLWHVECRQQEVPETSYKLANISIYM